MQAGLRRGTAATLTVGVVGAGAALAGFLPFLATWGLLAIAHLSLWIGNGALTGVVFLNTSKDASEKVVWSVIVLAGFGIAFWAAIVAWHSIGAFGRFLIVALPVAALAVLISGRSKA